MFVGAVDVDVIRNPDRTLDITVSGVTDPDRAPVKITIASIWQDEPVDTDGSGKTLVDGAGIGTSIASVRAERTGIKSSPGDGWIYQINFPATMARAAPAPAACWSGLRTIRDRCRCRSIPASGSIR